MNNQISSWSIIKVFFQAFTFYNSIENNFKVQVKNSISKSSNASVCSFEAFIKYLDNQDIALLRDKFLIDLRRLSHAEFRSRKKLERFDVYISEIFHEVSILKEQKYILEHYFQRKDQLSEEELNQMLNQTFELFDTKMKHIKVLFNNAKSRLEEILPSYRNDDFILRKLYLDGAVLFKEFYKDPVKNMLDFMFQEGGFPEGYIAIACSFSSGGFFENGNKVILELKKDDLNRLSPKLKDLYKKVKVFLKNNTDHDNLAVTYQSFLAEVKPDILQLRQV